MLYDPKWEKKTKADPVSIHGLIEWMEQQEPSTKYNWDCVEGGCLIGLYYSHLDKSGIPHSPYYAQMFRKNPGSYGPVCATEPRTIGAALSRARALLTEQ